MGNNIGIRSGKKLGGVRIHLTPDPLGTWGEDCTGVRQKTEMVTLMESTVNYNKKGFQQSIVIAKMTSLLKSHELNR